MGPSTAVGDATSEVGPERMASPVGGVADSPLVTPPETGVTTTALGGIDCRQAVGAPAGSPAKRWPSPSFLGGPMPSMAPVK
ncbi:hypothetical protein E2562_002599 [Oryza meyeriana var. granulata]|uniref:Uncharacterized protein n=1 Tax=Oryza meyeriana var. granulata TaxID=110450 RepID=A0A6G1F2Z5_9ORYZ|nr:hypothetical protein E2562_002599 [Oryza meyeriana var. granulata]